MPAKYRGIIKHLFVLSLFLLPSLLQAQNTEDTIRSIISEMQPDSVAPTEEPPPEEKEVYEGYQETPAVKGSVYFLNKSLQSHGGGPDSLQVRKLPDTLTRKMKQEDDFWYVNYEFDKKKRQEKAKAKKEEDGGKANTEERINVSRPFTETPFFQTLLWLIIIGGFAACVVLYLSNSNANLFRRRSKTLGSDGEELVETDNIFEINYQREIDKAISIGNYRFAVRLLFLRVLKNLSEKRVIDYKQDRTNFDYLSQVHSTKYYNDFFRLTLNYEYSWYGQFDIDSEKFGRIKNEFEKFDHNLK